MILIVIFHLLSLFNPLLDMARVMAMSGVSPPTHKIMGIKDVAMDMAGTPIGWGLIHLGNLAGILDVVVLMAPKSNVGTFILIIKGFLNVLGNLSMYLLNIV